MVIVFIGINENWKKHRAIMTCRCLEQKHQNEKKKNLGKKFKFCWERKRSACKAGQKKNKTFTEKHDNHKNTRRTAWNNINVWWIFPQERVNHYNKKYLLWFPLLACGFAVKKENHPWSSLSNENKRKSFLQFQLQQSFKIEVTNTKNQTQPLSLRQERDSLMKINTKKWKQHHHPHQK